MWKYLPYALIYTVAAAALSPAVSVECSVHVPANATHGFDVIGLLNRGLMEFDLPHLNFRIQVSQYVNDTVRPSRDEQCTIVFDEFDGFGRTWRWPGGELDMQINADRFPDEKTLYITVLHELGHMYGMDHPLWGQRDTVMGYVLAATPEQLAIPVTFWSSLTRADVRRLYKAGVDAGRIDLNVARWVYRVIRWTFPVRIYE